MRTLLGVGGGQRHRKTGNRVWVGGRCRCAPCSGGGIRGAIGPALKHLVGLMPDAAEDWATPLASWGGGIQRQ
jgi:hypothetical protein